MTGNERRPPQRPAQRRRRRSRSGATRRRSETGANEAATRQRSATTGSASRAKGQRATPVRRRRARLQKASLRPGDAISQTFRAVVRRGLPFFGIALLAFVPQFFFDYMTYKNVFEPSGGLNASDFMLGQRPPTRSGWLEIASLVLSMFGAAVVQGIVIYVVVQDLRGARVSWGRAWSVTFSRLLSMLGIAIMVAVLVRVLAFVVAYLFAWIGFRVFNSPQLAILGAVAAGVGVGVYLAIRFAVSVPVTVIERYSPLKSMARSDRLTHGIRWPILLSGIVVGIVPFAIVFFAASRWLNSVDWMQSVFVGVAANALLGMLTAVLIAVIYYNARKTAEGVDADDIAEVFA